MSVTNMAQVAVTAEAVKAAPEGAEVSSAYNKDTALNRVAAFIPSEAVAVYLALWAFIDPDEPLAKWTVFGVGLALVLAFYFLAYLQRRRAVAGVDGPPARSVGVTLVLLLFAVVAFTAWAAAMPGNPFTQFTDQAVKIGGGAIIVLGVLMPKVADVLGLPAA
ncbi:hypothetical protein GCM10022221_50270 [Actinocorallia aurea]